MTLFVLLQVLFIACIQYSTFALPVDDYEIPSYSEETHSLLCTNELVQADAANYVGEYIPSFLRVIHDGVFTVNITELRQYYQDDGSFGHRRLLDFMDVQLIGRNPAYFAASRDAASSVLDQLPPTLREYASILGAMQLPRCLDSPAGKIVRGSDRRLATSLAAKFGSQLSDVLRPPWFEWCSLPAPCTARGPEVSLGTDEGSESAQTPIDHLCRIKVNPLHDYCLMVPKLLHPAKPELPPRTAADGGHPAVSYRVIVPMLGDSWVWRQIEAVVGFVTRPGAVKTADPLADLAASWKLLVRSVERGDAWTGLDAAAQLPLSAMSASLLWLESIREVTWAVEVALSVIRALPTYVVAALLSAHIYSNADELAASSLLQSILVMTCGVLLGLGTLLFVLYSTVEQLVPLPRRMVPFASKALLGLGVFLPAALLGRSGAYFLFQHVVKQYLVEFWNNGMFGLPWLGKAYCSLYALGAVAVTRWMRLFTDDSSSRWVLNQCVRGLGLYLLLGTMMGGTGAMEPLDLGAGAARDSAAYSSSTSLCIGNVEVCAALTAAICAYEWCSNSLPSWYVSFVGQYLQKPTIVYSGRRRLTAEEYEAEGRYYTEKALRELQQQLADDPKYTRELSDKLYRGGRYLQSNMLRRFAHGDYDGRPGSPSGVVYRGWWGGGKGTWRLLLWVLPVALAAGAAAAYGTTHWQQLTQQSK